MAVTDIQTEKNQLRAKYKNFRKGMSAFEKEKKDQAILGNTTSLSQYKNCSMVVTYVSMPIEVDTHRLIKKALQDKKIVAVPRCVENTRLMDFYVIKSLEDLKEGSFSVLEPNPEKCKKVTQFDNSICIVPGLSFDPGGFRLGFGKGYYDRFLSTYNGTSIGVCYSNCMNDKLPRDNFDKSVDIIVTEDYSKKIKKEV